MKAEMETINLKDIKDNPENVRSDQGNIEELANDILKHGLINPITIRKDPKEQKKYIIVAGSRRFAALKLNKTEFSNFNVLDIGQDEAMEITAIENLQRENISPLDEAQLFETLSKTNTPEQLEEKLNVKYSYIIQRMTLLKLIPLAKKEFVNKKLTLDHILLLCKLEPEFQTIVLKDCTYQGFNEKNRSFKPVQSFKAYIDREILNSLGKVIFDINDNLLLKNAGSCKDCPKRTGANKDLFNEIQKDDYCLDRKCLQQKTEAHLIKIITQKVEDNEDIGFLKYYSNNPIVEKIIKTFKKIPLYNQYDYKVDIVKKETKKSFKALWISGDKLGTWQNIELRKDNSNSGSKDTNETLSVQDFEHKQKSRLDRAKELDRAKFGKLAFDLLETVPEYKPNGKNTSILLPIEDELFFYLLLLKSSSYQFREEIKKELFPKLNDNERSPDNNIAEHFRNMKAETKTKFIRIYIKHEFFQGNFASYEQDHYKYFSLMELVRLYKPEERGELIKQAQEAEQKRKDRALERIKKFKAEQSGTDKKKSVKSKNKKK